jgi:hypothetical protein
MNWAIAAMTMMSPARIQRPGLRSVGAMMRGGLGSLVAAGASTGLLLMSGSLLVVSSPVSRRREGCHPEVVTCRLPVPDAGMARKYVTQHTNTCRCRK